MVEMKITITGKDESSGAVGSVEGSFDKLFNGIRSDLQGMNKHFEASADKIVEAFGGVGDRIKQKAQSGGGSNVGFALGPIAGVLVKGLTAIGGIAFNAMKSVVSVVGTALYKASALVVNIFTGAFKTVVSVAGSILSGIGSAVSFALQGIGGILDTVLLTPFRLVFNKITALAAGVGVGAGVKFAADFQDSLSVAFSLIPDEITESMRTSMRRVLEDLRADTGAGGKELGRALFTAISTGFGAAAPAVVGAAAKLAAVGESADDVGSTTQALVGVLRAYNLEAKDAAKIADMLQMAQKLGNITNAEVAAQLGRVISAAKGANITLQDLLATISLSTVKGMTAEQAFTGLGGAIVSLSAPSPEAAKRLKSMNVELHDAQGQFIGLYDAIKKLAGLNLDVQKLREIIPEKMARNFFIAISGSLEKYKEFIGGIEGASGVLDQAMEERGRSVSRQFSRITGNIANLFSTAFSFIDEELAGFAERTADVIDKLTGKLRKLEDEGKIDDFKKSLGEAFDKIGEWLPTLEEVKGGLKGLMEAGINTWAVITHEFNVFKDAMTAFFSGKEGDLSDSLIVTGFQLAFEYMKEGAVDTVNYIKGKFSDLFSSDFTAAVIERFNALWGLVGVNLDFQLEKLRLKLDKKILDIGGYAASKLSSTDRKIFGVPQEFDPEEAAFIINTKKVIKAAEERERKAAPYEEIIKKTIGMGAIKYEGAETQEALKAKIGEILERVKAGAGAEKKAGAAVDATIAPVEKFVDAVVELVKPVTEEVKEDKFAEHKHAIQEATKRLEESRDQIAEFSHEQAEYMATQGAFNQDIANKVRALVDEMLAEKQQIKILQEAIGGG